MTREKASLSRADQLGDLILFRARYRTFRFSRHSHDDFALGLMYEGVQQFFYRGQSSYAPAGSLITVNPGEIHDGMSGDRKDFAYRIIYIPYELMQQIGNGMVAGRRNHYFGGPVVESQRFAGELAGIFQMLDNGDTDMMELQVHFYNLVARLLERYGTEKKSFTQGNGMPSSVRKSCDYIINNAREPVTLDDIAGAAGLSRYHFLRLFRDSMHLSPYSFLLHQRLQLTREAIRNGQSLADAALWAGFADQSHMSRRFKKAFGITPGQYQKAVC